MAFAPGEIAVKMLLRAVIFFLFFSWAGASPIIAQGSSPISKLLTELRLAHDDSALIDIHTELAAIYISERANAERAIDHANLALILAQNTGDKRREFFALEKLLSAQYSLQHDLEAAMELLEMAQAIDTSATTELDRAELLGHEGHIFLALNDFERSQSLFLQQLKVYEKNQYVIGVAKVNFALGQLFSEQNNFKQALENYSTALGFFEEKNDTKGKMRSLNAMGRALGNLGQFQPSLSRCSDALLLARAINDRPEMARVNTNLGFACEGLGRTEDAMNYYTTALEVAEEIEDRQLVAETAVKLGDLYFSQNDSLQAGLYFELAESNVANSESLALKKNVYNSLCPYFELTGQDSLAYECLKILVDLKDELFNEEQAKHLITSQIRYETQRREEEVKQLKAKELENQLTIQQQRMGNYALLVAVLVAGGLAFFLYQSVQRKKSYNLMLEGEVQKRTQELQDSNGMLSESNGLLERSNSELERFAYIASHDLKSPLRNIISFLNLIERKLKSHNDTDLKEYLNYASSNARQMHLLIQDVLEFSKVDHQDTKIDQVNMNETMVMVMQNLKNEMEAKNAVVYAYRLPELEANSVQIIQLLQNLISNGIKYNQSNHPKVIVSHRTNQKKHVFSVRDNGIGISPEYHEKVFQMFKRLHTKEDYPGTGIGLALCHKIVSNLGGKIWLESGQGKGTTFHFSIPRE